MLHKTLVNLTLTIRRKYVPDLLLGPGTGLNIVRCNTVIESTVYIKVTVSNTVLGSIVCIKNKVLGSTARDIDTVPVDLKVHCAGTQW